MIQLLYLILVALAMGLALWRLLGIEEDDGLSSLFLYFGTGLAVFVLFSAVLGFLNLVNWMVYLAIALAMLALVHMKGRLSVSMPKIDRGWVIVLTLFALHLAVYLYGSFSYPWLEDDDPWVHASAVRYVSIYGTYIQPEHLPLHYLAPYPPFFDALLGVLFQVDGSSLQFTLKFFNALLVSLTIPLFYVWARKKLDGTSALWATGMLAALPSFMSHFVWAQTLAMLLTFPAFYFIERYLNEKDGSKKSLGILAVFLLASVMISQPSVAGIIFIMSCIYVFASNLPKALEKKLDLGEVLRHGAVLIGALALALLLFWGPMFLLYGQEKVFGQMGLSSSFVTEKNDDTSGGVVYGMSDFLDAPSSSKMDQPIGLGLFISLLCLIGLAGSALKLKAGENTSLHLLLTLGSYSA